MNVIDKNVSFLNELNVFEKVLVFTTQSSDENFRFWNLLLMVDEKTGTFLKISSDAYFIEDAYIVTIKALLPLKSESPKLQYQLVGLLDGTLPHEIEDIINSSFSLFNNQK